MAATTASTMMKKGDFVELNYTGTLTQEKLVFDTTEEKIAKQQEIYNADATSKYKPAIICVGQNSIVKGLDDELVGKELNKEYTIVLPPEKAFGKKDAKLIQLVPTSKFLQQKIQPIPGLQVTIDNEVGTIKMVSGGRTLVDFNHPLASKEVSYTIKALRIVTDTKEKLTALMRLQFNEEEVQATLAAQNGKNDSITATISLKAFQKFPQELLDQLSQEFSKKVHELIPEITAVALKQGKSQEKDIKKPA
ncbi:TPA: peptidylprolyl isomerase [Candidatus Woesearchaeota archaeon]|nr:peptidylprolyl isomerase [Candidatus Woesearchaeota archaeon]HIH47358.1 peptidylprolyl isomerase [Candidatus Woesearchaeota archaeon]HII88908.1 peptidylprolyl isomerase [Candidatus Woesearchaeota archaeon]